MPTDIARHLRQTIDRELRNLRSLTEGQSSLKPAGLDAWSPKQELGHLIDSAANNHIRFVRAAITPESAESPLQFDGYAQDAWVETHSYQDMSWLAIIDFWSQYNYFLAGLIEQIPSPRLRTNCRVASDPPATLRFLIEDYVVHMQHHLDHLLKRPVITIYPQVVPTTI